MFECSRRLKSSVYGVSTDSGVEDVNPEAPQEGARHVQGFPSAVLSAVCLSVCLQTERSGDYVW